MKKDKKKKIRNKKIPFTMDKTMWFSKNQHLNFYIHVHKTVNDEIQEIKNNTSQNIS